MVLIFKKRLVYEKTLVQYQWMDVKVQRMFIWHARIVMVSLELYAFASTAGFMSDFAICHLQRSLCPLCCINDSSFSTIYLGVFRTGWVVVYNRKYGVACTVTRFVPINAKFGLYTIVSKNGILVEPKNTHLNSVAVRSWIHWIRIRIQLNPDPDPAFQLNPDPDPGFWWKKMEKRQLKKCICFWSKIGIYLSHVSLKDVQATGEAFSHQKRTSSTSKMKYINFFYFIGHFCSPGSGSGSGSRDNSSGL